jgi:RHH-type transcriptional regulator, proline utilization regulon repressor / proline dehydrogenase / delta 1-pyrroline-5-carboxylate dehydrogenase
MDIVFANPPPPATELRAALRDSCREDETEAVARILAAVEIPADMRDRIAQRARGFVAVVRRQRLGKGGIDAFLHEYALSSPEGVALLCLAEALLRIPDAETVDRLIRDKIGQADWESHLGRSESIFVNASTWALMLTGRLLRTAPTAHDLRTALRRFVARSGEPVVRQALMTAMHILGRQFVMGRTIEEALGRAGGAEQNGYRHSYDMLGEAAHTAVDAARYAAATTARSRRSVVRRGTELLLRPQASRSNYRPCTRATRRLSASGFCPNCLRFSSTSPATQGKSASV